MSHEDPPPPPPPLEEQETARIGNNTHSTAINGDDSNLPEPPSVVDTPTIDRTKFVSAFTTFEDNAPQGQVPSLFSSPGAGGPRQRASIASPLSAGGRKSKSVFVSPSKAASLSPMNRTSETYTKKAPRQRPSSGNAPSTPTSDPKRMYSEARSSLTPKGTMSKRRSSGLSPASAMATKASPSTTTNIYAQARSSLLATPNRGRKGKAISMFDVSSSSRGSTGSSGKNIYAEVRESLTPSQTFRKNAAVALADLHGALSSDDGDSLPPPPPPIDMDVKSISASTATSGSGSYTTANSASYVGADGKKVTRVRPVISPKHSPKRGFSTGSKRMSELKMLQQATNMPNLDMMPSLQEQKSSELNHLTSIIANLRKVQPPKLGPITMATQREYRKGDKSEQHARSILNMLRNLRKTKDNEPLNSSSTHSKTMSITDDDGKDLLDIMNGLKQVGALGEGISTLIVPDETDVLKQAYDLLHKAYLMLDDRDWIAKQLNLVMTKLSTLLPEDDAESRRKGGVLDSSQHRVNKKNPWDVLESAMHTLETNVSGHADFQNTPKAELLVLDGMELLQNLAMQLLDREEEELAKLIRTTATNKSKTKKRLSLIADTDSEDDDFDVELDDDEEIDELAQILAELKMVGDGAGKRSSGKGSAKGRNTGGLGSFMSRNSKSSGTDGNSLEGGSQHTQNTQSSLQSSLSKEDADSLANCLRRLKKADMTEKQADAIATVIYHMQKGSGEEDITDDMDNIFSKLKPIVGRRQRKLNEITNVLKVIKRLDMDNDDLHELAELVGTTLGHSVHANLTDDDMDFLDDILARFQDEISPTLTEKQAEYVANSIFTLKHIPVGTLPTADDDEYIESYLEDPVMKSAEQPLQDGLRALLKGLRHLDINEDEETDLANALVGMVVPRPPETLKGKSTHSTDMSALTSVKSESDHSVDWNPENSLEEELFYILSKLSHMELTPRQADFLADIIAQLSEVEASGGDEAAMEELLKKLRHFLDNPDDVSSIAANLIKLRATPGFDKLEGMDLANRVRNQHGARPKLEEELAGILTGLRRVERSPKKVEEAVKNLVRLRKTKFPPKNGTEKNDPLQVSLRKFLPKAQADELFDELDRGLSAITEESPEGAGTGLANRVANVLNQPAPKDLEDDLQEALRRLKKLTLRPQQAEEVADLMVQLRKVPKKDRASAKKLIDGLRPIIESSQVSEIQDILQNLRKVPDMGSLECLDFANRIRLQQGFGQSKLEEELADLLCKLKRIKPGLGSNRKANQVAKLLFNLRKTKYPHLEDTEKDPFHLSLRKVLPKKKADDIFTTMNKLRHVEFDDTDHDAVSQLANCVTSLLAPIKEEEDDDDDIPAESFAADTLHSSYNTYNDDGAAPVEDDDNGEFGEEALADDEDDDDPNKKAEKARAKKKAKAKVKKLLQSDDDDDDDDGRVGGGEGPKYFATKPNWRDFQFHHAGKKKEEPEVEEEEYDAEGNKIVFDNRHHWKHKKHNVSIQGDVRYKVAREFGADQVLYSPLSKDQYRRRKTVGAALLKHMTDYDSQDDMVMDGYEKDDGTADDDKKIKQEMEEAFFNTGQRKKVEIVKKKRLVPKKKRESAL